ncbi:MAG: winged helix-turn-helix transcriptional regulator, partial [Planctomycetales bacterium]|nr:winged helix-turn-helix transcriptional regulator [Planctomycetales bacterium]
MMVTSASSLDWLQTLADGTRVRLLRLLEQEELSVSELCTIVQLPQSTVSRHLKVLAGDSWIVNRREGTNQLYRVETSEWATARGRLWQWVREQADTPTTILDQQRLVRLIAERSRSEAFFSSTAEQWDKLRVELFGQQLDAHVLAATLPRRAVVGELGCGSAPLSYLV